MWRLSKTIYYLNFKLLFVYRHTASLKLWISKVQDLGNFKLSPMEMLHAAFYQSHHTLWKQKRSSEKGIHLKNNNNLWPLNIYCELSQVYIVSNQKE